MCPSTRCLWCIQHYARHLNSPTMVWRFNQIGSTPEFTEVSSPPERVHPRPRIWKQVQSLHWSSGHRMGSCRTLLTPWLKLTLSKGTCALLQYDVNCIYVQALLIISVVHRLQTLLYHILVKCFCCILFSAPTPVAFVFLAATVNTARRFICATSPPPTLSFNPMTHLHRPRSTFTSRT